MKIKYLGKMLPKIVELPIPFMFKSEKTGEVICDPIGEFNDEDGQALLDINGPDGMFVRVDEDISTIRTELGTDPSLTKKKDKDEPEEMPFCKCGCGERIVWRNSYKYTKIPSYLRGHFAKVKSTIPESTGGENKPSPDVGSAGGK